MQSHYSQVALSQVNLSTAMGYFWFETALGEGDLEPVQRVSHVSPENRWNNRTAFRWFRMLLCEAVLQDKNAACEKMVRGEARAAGRGTEGQGQHPPNFS